MEIWKDITGYNGIYQISNYGRVKSFYKDKKGIILKTHPTNLGYIKISLKNKNLLIHRLVAIAFVKNVNPKIKTEVNHIDGDKSNNHFTNLEWCTRSENTKHSWDTGLREAKTGDDHHNSKLNKKQVIDIRKLKGLKTQRQISKIFKVSPATIWRIHNNKIYRQY